MNQCPSCDSLLVKQECDTLFYENLFKYCPNCLVTNYHIKNWNSHKEDFGFNSKFYIVYARKELSKILVYFDNFAVSLYFGKGCVLNAFEKYGETQIYVDVNNKEVVCVKNFEFQFTKEFFLDLENQANTILAFQ